MSDPSQFDSTHPLPEDVATPPAASSGSQIRTELLGAGYRLIRSETCSKCSRSVDVFESVDGRQQEFNSLSDPISPAGVHMLTCRENEPEVRLPPVPDQQAYIDAITGKTGQSKPDTH